MKNHSYLKEWKNLHCKEKYVISNALAAFTVLMFLYPHICVHGVHHVSTGIQLRSSALAVSTGTH